MRPISTNKQKRALGAAAAPILTLLAVGHLPSCWSEQRTDPESNARLTETIHNEPSCAFDNLGIDGTLLESGLSRYGVWCGATNTGPADPINCWDNGCRTHDYAFHGPGGSGWVSCHEVINDVLCDNGVACLRGVPLPNTAPDTDCIRAADHDLCDAWYDCTAQARATEDTWEWVGNGRNHRVRRCVDPRAGNHGFPVRCTWYEHPMPGSAEVWTCGACPGAAPLPPTLPNPACAVRANLSSDQKLEQCCSDYAGDVRPDAPSSNVCACPAEKPLRRDLGATFAAAECRSCPTDRPVWNGQPGPCLEAYAHGDAPSNAVECCTATANLDTSAVATPQPVLVHDAADFQFNIANHGPANARGVTAMITFASELPPSTALFRISTSGGAVPCTTTGNQIICAIGTLDVYDPNSPAPTIATIEGNATTTVPGQFSAIMVVTATTSDPNLDDNSARAVWDVECPPATVEADGQCIPQCINQFAYITNTLSNTVSIIDTATDGVVATVAVGSNPFGVAVNPLGTRTYVTNRSSNSVSIIDGLIHNVIATVPVGSLPWGIAATGSRVYVGNRNGNTVSVIDTATNSVIATIAIGTPSGLAINPLGTRLYAADMRNAVTVIDTGANAVIGSIQSTGCANGLAVDRTGTRVHAATGCANGYSLLDVSAGQEIATTRILSGGQVGVAVNPRGDYAYTTSDGNVTQAVTVVNAATGSVVASVPMDAPFGISTTPMGDKVYVANEAANTVTVMDGSTHQVLTTIPVGTQPTAYGKFIASCE